MSVRIDKTGQNNASAKIEFLARRASGSRSIFGRVADSGDAAFAN